MSDWPKYESHKIVRAARIIGFDMSSTGEARRACATVDPGTGYYPEAFNPTHDVMLEEAKIGDWAIIYSDGFKSISPAKAFEDGYTPCP